jgi:hypothetical protein
VTDPQQKEEMERNVKKRTMGNMRLISELYKQVRVLVCFASLVCFVSLVCMESWVMYRQGSTRARGKEHSASSSNRSRDVSLEDSSTTQDRRRHQIAWSWRAASQHAKTEQQDSRHGEQREVRDHLSIISGTGEDSHAAISAGVRNS